MDADTKTMADILKSANILQDVQRNIHTHRHILDIPIFHEDHNLIDDVSTFSVLSDTFL